MSRDFWDDPLVRLGVAYEERKSAIAIETAKPPRRETGSARKGESAGRKASPTITDPISGGDTDERSK